MKILSERDHLYNDVKDSPHSLTYSLAVDNHNNAGNLLNNVWQNLKDDPNYNLPIDLKSVPDQQVPTVFCTSNTLAPPSNLPEEALRRRCTWDPNIPSASGYGFGPRQYWTYMANDNKKQPPGEANKKEPDDVPKKDFENLPVQGDNVPAGGTSKGLDQNVPAGGGTSKGRDDNVPATEKGSVQGDTATIGAVSPYSTNSTEGPQSKNELSDNYCKLKLNDLLAAEAILKEQIEDLEKKEKRGIEMLKEADELWLSMEESYKSKVSEAAAKHTALVAQIKEIESSASKWRKNKTDLLFQIAKMEKVKRELVDNTLQKKNDIKVIMQEIKILEEREKSNATDLENLKKVMASNREAANARMAKLAEKMTKLEKKTTEQLNSKKKKEKEGATFVQDARNDLQQLCKALMKKKLENEDLIAEKKALLDELELLDKTSDACKLRCENKEKAMKDEIARMEKEIASHKLKCIKCHQCTDTNDTRRFCIDCPRCAKMRECIYQTDFCTADPTMECVCMSVKQRFLDNVFENMYTILEQQSKTPAGKAVADVVLDSLKKSRNGKLSADARKAVQDFVLTTIKQQLNLTIIGGAVKTRCELDPDTYKQLTLCLNEITVSKPDSKTVATGAKKPPCSHWGGTNECQCPRGPKACICTRKAPKPPPNPPSTCDNKADDGAPSAATKTKRKPEANCQDCCGKGQKTKSLDVEIAEWIPLPCSEASCKQSRSLNTNKVAPTEDKISSTSVNATKALRIETSESVSKCDCGVFVPEHKSEEYCNVLMKDTKQLKDIGTSYHDIPQRLQNVKQKLDKSPVRTNSKSNAKSIIMTSGIACGSIKGKQMVEKTKEVTLSRSPTVTKVLEMKKQKLDLVQDINIKKNKNMQPFQSKNDYLEYMKLRNINKSSSSSPSNILLSEDVMEIPLLAKISEENKCTQTSCSYISTTSESNMYLQNYSQEFEQLYENGNVVTLNIENNNSFYKKLETVVSKSPSGRLHINLAKSLKAIPLSTINPANLLKIKSENYLLKINHRNCTPNAVLNKNHLSGHVMLIPWVENKKCHQAKKHYKVKIIGYKDHPVSLPMVLNETESGNYVIIFDKEFEKLYKKSVQDYIRSKEECFVLVKKTSSDYLIDLNTNGSIPAEELNALLVECSTGDIQLLVKGPTFESLDNGASKRSFLSSAQVLESLRTKLRPVSSREIHRENLRKSKFFSQKSNSDIDYYERVKIKLHIAKKILLDTNVIVKNAILLDKDLKQEFDDNLKRNLVSNLKDLENLKEFMPIGKTDSGQTKIGMKSMVDDDVHCGSSKITSTSDTYITCENESISEMNTKSLMHSKSFTNVDSKFVQIDCVEVGSKVSESVLVCSKGVATTCHGSLAQSGCDVTLGACAHLESEPRMYSKPGIVSKTVEYVFLRGPTCSEYKNSNENIFNGLPTPPPPVRNEEYKSGAKAEDKKDEIITPQETKMNVLEQWDYMPLQLPYFLQSTVRFGRNI